ncbi:MAG: hypothetical protein PUD20_12080 [bacterium]|nr:hypothetical protein [bacterium]
MDYYSAEYVKEYKRGTAYMSKELKKVDKKSTNTFREAENRQLDQEYMTAMGQGYVWAKMFGMKETDFGPMKGVSTARIERHYNERMEARRIHQITESGKKKKSEQETDAKERMGNYVFGRMQMAANESAANVLQLYQEKKEQELQPENPQIMGDEFYPVVKNRAIGAQMQEQQISDLMLKRDQLAVRVKNANPESDMEKAEHEYNRQLLVKLSDALRTWMAVGGISENGKSVSDREKAKAMQHLALAVESYEYYARYGKVIIGGMLKERFRKNNQLYKDYYKQIQEASKIISKETIGLKQPMMMSSMKETVNLRKLISDNGPYDEKKKALITSVYGEFMQHNVAYSKMVMDHRTIEYGTSLWGNKQEEYLMAWCRNSNYEIGQHELAMDAATAYIKYLVQGTTPDPTMAVYIEQHWKTNVFEVEMREVPDDLYGDDEDYKERIRDRIETIHCDDTLSEDKKESLIHKLYDALDGPVNQKEERLLSSSSRELDYNRFVKENCQVTQNDPNCGGYRDIARLMMRVDYPSLGLDAQKVRDRKIGLVKVTMGTYLGDQKDAQGNPIEYKMHGMKCTRKERLEELDKLRPVIKAAQEDLEDYVWSHADSFGIQSLEDAYRNVDIPTKAYKKAQALRDTCALICESSLFDQLSEQVQEQLTESWIYGAALTEMTHNRTAMLSGIWRKSFRKIVDAGDCLANLGMTLEDYKELAREQIEVRLSKRTASRG